MIRNQSLSVLAISVVSSSNVRSYFYWQALSLGIMKTTVEAQSGADCPSGAHSDSLSLLVRRRDSLGINWHNFSLLGRTSTHLAVTEEEESVLQIVLRPCSHQRGHDKTAAIESVWIDLMAKSSITRKLSIFNGISLFFFAYKLTE